MISADGEHHRERQQVLESLTANEKRGGDEEEIERRDVDERRQHRRPAPERTATSTTASRNSITMLARSKYGSSGVATSDVASARGGGPHIARGA